MHKHTPAHTHACVAIYNIWHNEKCQTSRTIIIVKLALAIKDVMKRQWGCASQNMINSVNIRIMINIGWFNWQGYTTSRFAGKEKKDRIPIYNEWPETHACALALSAFSGHFSALRCSKSVDRGLQSLFSTPDSLSCQCSWSYSLAIFSRKISFTPVLGYTLTVPC